MTEVKQVPLISNSWPSQGSLDSENWQKLYVMSGASSSSGTLSCEAEPVSRSPRMKDTGPNKSSNDFREEVRPPQNVSAGHCENEEDISISHGFISNESFPHNLFEDQEGLLIPGLTDDVAKSCLALVPRLDFPAMSCVSRAWKALLQSKEFYFVRKNAGTLEEWLYACVDVTGSRIFRWQVLSPDCNKWKSLPSMPGPATEGFGFAVIDGKLLVIGGSFEESTGTKAVADVLKYDSALNRWSKVTSMHIARYEFACAVLGGRVYVVGGHGDDGKNLSSVEVYDLQKNEWSHAPSMKRARWGCFAWAVDEKIYVMGGRSSFTIGSSRCIALYDTSVGQWNELKNGCVMVLAHAVLDKKIYCIEWKNERKLAVYNVAENCWKYVPLPLTGSLSVGFCLGHLNGKLLLFPRRADTVCKTLVYNPDGIRGSEWQTSAIRPLGSCMFCVTITA